MHRFEAAINRILRSQPIILRGQGIFYGQNRTTIKKKVELLFLPQLLNIKIVYQDFQMNKEMNKTYYL